MGAENEELLVCPTCQAAHPVGTHQCPYDGTALVQPEPDLLLGTVIDQRYAIQKRIGEGGMGVVYRAEQLNVGRLVAVKVLHRQLTDPATVSRFENEAKIISQLRHPNTLRLIDFGRTPEGRPYLVAELLDGLSLEQMLALGPLDIMRALSILRQICESLSEAHQGGIIHRDLKPQNVFLDRVGDREVVKVVDFGIAKAATRSVKTATGVVVGTPAYMSPEQAQGAKVDPRTDLYSLGVIAYQALSGRLPFDAETPVGLLVKHVTELPPAIGTLDLPAPLPPELEALVMSLLSKNPDLRPASANEVRTALERIERIERRDRPSAPSKPTSDAATAALDTTPLAKAPEVGPTRDTHESAPVRVLDSGASRSVPSRYKTIPIAGALLAAIAVIGGAIALYNRRPEEPEKQDPAPAKVAHLRPITPTFKQLTDQPGVERDPALSPDAKFIAYSGDRLGHWDIYLLRVGGERAINLTEQSSEDETAPAFSPDGSQIAYASSRDGNAIYVMGSTGESIRRIADRGFNPVWSPDQKEIFYVTEGFLDPTSRSSVSELWAVDLATLKSRPVYAGDAMQPQISPHGLRIAYWANNGGQRDIFTIERAGSIPVPVTSDKALDYNPLWSPAGDELYFLSDRTGSINLWRVSIDEATGRTRGEAEPVTSGATSISQATIAPTGLIAYTSETDTYSLKRYAFDSRRAAIRGEATTIHESSRAMRHFDLSPDAKRIAYWNATGETIGIMDADGSSRRVLVQDGSRSRGPAFSPDGKQLAFFTNRSGDYRVWLISSGGGAARMLTDGLSTIQAVWSPDGKRIATTDLSRGTRVFTVPAGDQPTRELLLLEGTLEGDHAFQAGSWSPNAEELAGSMSGNGKPAIYSLSKHRLEILSLPSDRDNEGHLAWFPDGKRLLLTARHEIAVVERRRATKKRILASAKGDDFIHAVLTKDGKNLYVLSRHAEADLWSLRLD